MPNLVRIVREYELDELRVCLFHLNPDNLFLRILAGTVDFLVVHSIFELQSLKPQAHELEQSLQVVRRRRSHEDVAET